MNKRECRETGFETGYRIAEHNAHEIARKWTAYDEDLLEYDCLHDAIVGEACQTESEVHRQYSPFEHFAHEINESGDRADGLWEAYDDGVARGASKAATEYLKRVRREGRGYLAVLTRARRMAVDHDDELALVLVLERVRRRLGLDEEGEE